MGTENIQIVATAQDRASPALRKLRGNVAALGTASTGPVGRLTAGLGGISPVGIAASIGVGMLTAALADGVAGALEEEKQIARLTTVLRANVKGWDGSTEAVDRAVEASMDLAFADSDAREGIIKLIAATGSVEQATRQWSIAMDLARLKNISGAEAAQLLVLANVRQYRGLRTLGIQIDSTATSTEALARVQEVVAGQADAYAKTKAGRLESAQIKVNEVMEDAGNTAITMAAAFLGVGDALQGDTAAGAAFFRMAGSLGIPMMNELADAAERAGNALRIIPGHLAPGGAINKPVFDRETVPDWDHGRRAAGGPANAGQSYLVGERGPEVLHMGRNSGSIQANHQLGGHGHAIVLNGRILGQAVDEYLGNQLSRMPTAPIHRG